MPFQFPLSTSREQYSLEHEKAFVDSRGKKWQWNSSKFRWEPFEIYASDESYDAESWAGKERAPTKNAIRDAIITFSDGTAELSVASLSASNINATGDVTGITAEMVGLGNVDDTSDIDKPISDATLAELNKKAPIGQPYKAVEGQFESASTILSFTDVDDVIVKSKIPGPEGNALSAQVAINTTDARTALTTNVNDGLVLITSGDKKRIIVDTGEDIGMGILVLNASERRQTGTSWATWNNRGPNNTYIDPPQTGNHATLYLEDSWVFDFIKDGVVLNPKDIFPNQVFLSNSSFGFGPFQTGKVTGSGTIEDPLRPVDGYWPDQEPANVSFPGDWGIVSVTATAATTEQIVEAINANESLPVTAFIGEGDPAEPVSSTEINHLIDGDLIYVVDQSGVPQNSAPGQLAIVNGTDTYVSIDKNVWDGPIATTEFVKNEIATTVINPPLVITSTNVLLGETLSGEVTPPIPATSLGQIAIVGEKDVYVCTKLNPVKWKFSSAADLTLSGLTITDTEQSNVRTNINVRQLHSKVFTPTSIGWWRIVTHSSVIGGVIRVTADDGTKTTDIEVSIHVDKDNRGVMNQTRHSVRGGGHISKFRVARNQNGLVICDVNVTAANIPLRLEADGILFPGFITPTPITVNILDNETNQVDDLELGNGLRSSGPIISHLGSSRDPGTSLGIAGRARYLHGLALAAGNDRFTNGSDHFHLTWRGANGSGSGSRTAQGGSSWNTWQGQNSNSTASNEIFLGGLTAFAYAATPFGTDSKYGISTDRVETTGLDGGPPSAPDFAAEIDLWYNTLETVPTNGTTIMVEFPTGIAGISAAILPAIVLSRSLEDAPDGRLQENGTPLRVFRLRIKLYGLDPVEWNKSQATAFSPSTVWTTTVTPAQIVGNESLTPHPTRRDKVIAKFTQPHGMLLGQVLVLRLTDTSWGVPRNSYSGCITKVINDTTFEMKVGIVRGAITFQIGTREYITRSTSSTMPPNILQIPSHPFVDGEAVKLSVIGTMQDGLIENKVYFVERATSSPANHIYLHKSFPLDLDANSKTRVQFSRNSGFGLYYIHKVNSSPPLDSTGWSIHKGNLDPGHQQTISDVGWNLHRNVFEGRRGIAAGTVGRASLGGLCDMPREVIGSAAVGFNSSSEADFTYTFGRDLRNTTTNSVEIGTTDNFKLSITENTFNILSENSSIFSINNNSVFIKAEKTILTANATGTPGEVCFDDDFIYRCVATNTWKRSPLSTW